MKLSPLLLIALPFLGHVLPSQAALIAYYNYDNAGNLGQDSSGNGNNLTISGGVTAGTGEYGGGATFNGSSGILSGTVAGLPIGHSSYTIASWFNATGGGASGNGGIMGWGSYGASNRTNALRLDSNNRLVNYWWGNDLYSPTLGNLYNAWHYVAVTYDATTNFEAMYVDGVLVSSRTNSGYNATSSNFAIGKTYSNEYFQGTLDDTAIYNTALTASELLALKNGSLDNASAPEPDSLPLFASALLGLTAFVRRRNRRG